jgi:hypothetical protein
MRRCFLIWNLAILGAAFALSTPSAATTAPTLGAAGFLVSGACAEQVRVKLFDGGGRVLVQDIPCGPGPMLRWQTPVPAGAFSAGKAAQVRAEASDLAGNPSLVAELDLAFVLPEAPPPDPLTNVGEGTWSYTVLDSLDPLEHEGQGFISLSLSPTGIYRLLHGFDVGYPSPAPRSFFMEESLGRYRIEAGFLLLELPFSSSCPLARIATLGEDGTVTSTVHMVLKQEGANFLVGHTDSGRMINVRGLVDPQDPEGLLPVVLDAIDKAPDPPLSSSMEARSEPETVAAGAAHYGCVRSRVYDNKRFLEFFLLQSTLSVDE